MKHESTAAGGPYGSASPESRTPQLSRRGRWTVLAAVFAALLFDGMELGMMPVAARSVTADLLGDAFTEKANGQWFSWLMAVMMLGAACGGIWLGALGDRIGRTRALAVSVLFYSVFAGLGALVTSLPQMLALRFLVGLGVGGVWPNGIALVAECWPQVSRPIVAGIVGAALNAGILLLSQLVANFRVTPDSWRWLFAMGGVSAIPGLLCFFVVPESPGWKAARGAVRKAPTPLRDLLAPELRPALLMGIALGTVPLVGAWAAGKWMVPWAENAAGKAFPGYKASAQAYWAAGAVLGSFFGAQIAAALGRRLSYLLISIGAVLATGGMFLFTAPLRPEFLWIVLTQGFVTTLFFGWLPLYLPQLYPVTVRAAGTGIAYNSGRFATAAGLFIAGGIFAAMGSDYAKTGAVCSLVYALGIGVALLLPRDPKPADLNRGSHEKPPGHTSSPSSNSTSRWRLVISNRIVAELVHLRHHYDGWHVFSLVGAGASDLMALKDYRNWTDRIIEVIDPVSNKPSPYLVAVDAAETLKKMEISLRYLC